MPPKKQEKRVSLKPQETQVRVLWSSDRGARVPQKILNPRYAFYAIYQGLDGICIGGLRAVQAIEAEVAAPVNRPSIRQATGGGVVAHPAALGVRFLPADIEAFLRLSSAALELRTG